MVEIYLTQGYVAIVDDEDGDLAEFKWYAQRSRHLVYAARNGGRFPIHKLIFLHRVILERMLNGPISTDMETDHRDGNGLNNTRGNLRIATSIQNNANRREHRTNGRTSAYKGVSWDRRNKRWVSHIRNCFLGRFDTEQEAARAYNEAARREYGEFAKLNDV